MAVGRGVFVPRRRTELLVRLAVAIVRRRMRLEATDDAVGRRTIHPWWSDLCCGSGAIGAAVAAECPEAEVWAADVDPVAVACARRNLPAGAGRRGRPLRRAAGRAARAVDVLAVNAPYVPTDAIATMPPEARDHEPRAALDGGADGVDLHRRVAAGAPAWLAPGGRLLIETGRPQAR